MPNSHEGHRDTYKLLTLKRAPSKADRQEVLCPGGRGGTRKAVGGFREHPGTRSRCQCLWGGAFEAETTNQVQILSPEALPV